MHQLLQSREAPALPQYHQEHPGHHRWPPVPHLPRPQVIINISTFDLLWLMRSIIVCQYIFTSHA